MLTLRGIVQKRKSPDFRSPEASISAYYLFLFSFSKFAGNKFPFK